MTELDRSDKAGQSGSDDDVIDQARALGRAEALEARLSRLPPALPCRSCPSHDAVGDLRMVTPCLRELARADAGDDAALYICHLCGAEWTEPLLPPPENHHV
jgi:hypothetical protein